MKISVVVTAIGVALLTESALAAGPNVQGAVQRDVNQQDRIEQGLKSGELTTKEAGRLERHEAKIERTEARDVKRDGGLTKADQAHITRMQDSASADIYRDKHNGAAGNPDSASSKRMQADVQRDANRERRIGQGAKSGSLTNGEVSSLERGEARVDQKEARDARDGHVSAREQAGIRKAGKRQSHRIHHAKHDGRGS